MLDTNFAYPFGSDMIQESGKINSSSNIVDVHVPLYGIGVDEYLTVGIIPAVWRRTRISTR